MKKLVWVGVLLLAILSPIAVGQVVLVPPVTPATPVAASTELTAVDRVFATDDVSTHAVRTLDEVKKAISESEQLRPLQKNRLLRRLSRPWVAQRVTDEITVRAMAAGYVTVSLDEDGGDATVLVDWEGLAEFIERILPLIIQIIGLFG